MDILYRAQWKDRDRKVVDTPNASGIGRLAIAMCAIALMVGILETAPTDHSATIALNVAGQENMQ